MTHFDLNEVRAAAHSLAEKRREARRDYERYCEEKATAERDYRLRKAQVFAQERARGSAVEAAKIEADAQAAELVLKRDLADSLARSSLLRIEELEADRAMLNSLGQWSMRLEGLPQPQWTPKEAA